MTGVIRWVLEVSAFAMNSVSRPGAEDACRPILAALLASPGESELKPAKRRPVMGVFRGGDCGCPDAAAGGG
jgi:hypothetical protein